MKTKIKSVLQKITAGVLALVFVGTISLPKVEAATGVDDVSLGIMAVLVHLDSIGGSLAVQQGTALATQNAVTSLATQAAAAGVFGTGVTGAGALATIGGAVTAAAVGGFTIGYVGYETLSKLAEWIRQSRLTGTVENKIYQTGGRPDYLIDGSKVAGEGSPVYVYGRLYTTEAGSSFTVSQVQNGVDDNGFPLIAVKFKATSYYNDFMEYTTDARDFRYYGRDENNQPLTTYRVKYADITEFVVKRDLYAKYSYTIPSPVVDPNYFKDYFGPVTGVEKQEVTYVPPVTWSPPAPTLGQDVYYNPYPQMPQKPIKEIVEDVPKDIYDKKFDPAPPSILDPSIPPIEPPAPDIPPVNPNPDVTAPENVQPYTVRLGDVFPFCIPFDVYHMVTLFAAEPEAPHAKWEFSLPFTGGTYDVEWDLREWDEVAALCRKLELILFCVGLAVVTYKYIKW